MFYVMYQLPSGWWNASFQGSNNILDAYQFAASEQARTGWVHKVFARLP